MNHTARLPAESLCHIFSFVQDVDVIPRPGRNWVPKVPIELTDEEADRLRSCSHLEIFGTMHRLAWITSITHVCSRWRSVAMADSSLWSRPTIYLGLTWFKEMLRRSGDAMLSLSSHNCGLELWHPRTGIYLAGMFAEIASTQRHRIRTFEFKNSSGLSFLLTPFDALESFELTVEYAGNIMGPPLLPPSSMILNLFGGLAPCLRSLHITHKGLRYNQLPLHSPIWSQLQELRLFLSGPLLLQESDSEILHVLRHAQALVSLFLKATCGNYYVPHGEPSQSCGACIRPNFDPVVVSATLARLELHGCAPTIAHLLDHFHLPLSAKIHVTSAN